ncbi:hypothetical protein LP418_22995 [Nocardioides sp. B-3]|nr:hypothetical protein [Nocardioides sp. B-3]UUZ58896.1 hypothetical protein LP418_22995 [Nocardioides sp. B-3]
MSSSATKNGLPAVSRCTASASRLVPATTSSIASSDSGGRVTRRVARCPAGSPSATRSWLRGAVTLVAERHQQQCPQALDPATRVTQQVQRCVVGPVHVLDDRDGQRLAVPQLVDHGGEQQVPGLVRATGGEQVAAHVLGDVAQRGQGARRREAVAGPPEPGSGQSLLELLEQGRLADPGLTLDPGRDDRFRSRPPRHTRAARPPECRVPGKRILRSSAQRVVGSIAR